VRKDNEMNPRMTEFLAHDRIAGLRDEAAASHRVAKRGAEPKPATNSRPSHHVPSPVELFQRCLRRAVRT
jgi:hypothetical protein